MTLPRILTRRRFAALGLAVLLAVGLPAQALAAERFAFSGEAAFASWPVGDNTVVWIGAFDGQSHNPPGPPEDLEEVFAEVAQFFCDEDDNQLVFRVLWGFGDGSVDIDHARLSEAMADAELTLHGFEERIPDCDAPNFEEAQFQPLDPVEVSVTAAWEGDGDLNRSRSMFHFDGDGFKVRSDSMDRFRHADATGTLDGLDDDWSVGPELGEAQFADIASFRSSTIVIDQPR